MSRQGKSEEMNSLIVTVLIKAQSFFIYYIPFFFKFCSNGKEAYFYWYGYREDKSLAKE